MESSQLKTPDVPYSRISTAIVTPPEGTPSFVIEGQDKSFRHQYANIYFMRLHALRKSVEQRAKRRWGGIDGNPKFVPRVLDVTKGHLSYVVGTVYMDMPLKPNVLDDIARDHSIPAPSSGGKYHSADDSIMLEDESGRIRLIGDQLNSIRLVTGIIIGTLGIETNSGDFEVVDVCFPGMAPQHSRSITNNKNGNAAMDVDAFQLPHSSESDEWIAVVSGLDVGPSCPDGQLQMLVEYLTGESGGLEEQLGASRISRLIIAGNSLAPVTIATEDFDKRSRRYGQETSTFSPHPIRNLSAYLTDIARSMPIHLLPGPSDPTGTLLPQQPLPRAMFGAAASYSTFSCETNPTYLRISPSSEEAASSSRASPPATGKPSGSKAATKATTKTTNGSARHSDQHSAYERSILVHSGQPIDDMFRYLPSPPVSRLSIAEATLKWRHLAPTAPDTLWCHPYMRHEPFIVRETPDVYIVGNQPAFKTKLVSEEREEGRGGGGVTRCRIVLVPKFSESGLLVLVNLRTLQVRTVCIAVSGMSSGGAS